MLLLMLMPAGGDGRSPGERVAEAEAHQIFIVPESSPDLCVPVRRRVN